MRQRERDKRERQTDRQTDRQTETDRHRDRQTDGVNARGLMTTMLFGWLDAWMSEELVIRTRASSRGLQTCFWLLGLSVYLSFCFPM